MTFMTFAGPKVMVRTVNENRWLCAFFGLSMTFMTFGRINSATDITHHFIFFLVVLYG